MENLTKYANFETKCGHCREEEAYLCDALLPCGKCGHEVTVLKRVAYEPMEKISILSVPEASNGPELSTELLSPTSNQNPS